MTRKHPSGTCSLVAANVLSVTGVSTPCAECNSEIVCSICKVTTLLGAIVEVTTRLTPISSYSIFCVTDPVS
ncbi:Uncharacterised protein [Chlamydia trachomatis]|nr:Uncharacterised protein [Chlamydia trachomatis]